MAELAIESGERIDKGFEIANLLIKLESQKFS